MTLDDIVALIRRHGSTVTPSGDGFEAQCPRHNDQDPSLSLNCGDNGRVLVHCHAGCPIERVLAPLGLTTADLFPGLTLRAYAAAKRLPDHFLADLGLRDIRVSGRPALVIPYFNTAGVETAVQHRLALSGAERFRWRRGNRPQLYGLNRLQHARNAGHVTLVEGASDCHTLWLHNIPALGLPGAGTWQDERDAAHLDGLDHIYVVVEPDNGGAAVLRWLEASQIRHRARLVQLPGAKDPSEFYLLDPATFQERWDTVCRAARPWGEGMATAARAEAATSWAICEALARELRILDKFAEALEARGIVGEERAGKSLYLIVVSRFLERPVSAKIGGVSSVGKSSLVLHVLNFFPSDAYYALRAISEKVIAYSTEPLTHRMFVIYEAAGVQSDFANYLVRSLLSEGHVRYETVEKTPEGLRARLIERAGPTGLIVTTTKIRLHEENETRLLTVTANDTPQQTRAVLRAEAQQFTSAARAGADVETWHALQRWLATAEHRVVVPFADALAQLIPPVAVRLRRDFRSLLTLIQAHALLHQASRARDCSGAIIATVESDYAVVRDLVADLFAENVGAIVSATTRETVQAVRTLQPPLAFTENRSQTAAQGVTVTDLARALHVDVSTAWRRAQVAIERGFLKNLELHERRPAQLRTAAALPDHDTPLLPTPDEVCRFVCGSVGSDSTPPSGSGERDTELPATNDANLQTSEEGGVQPTLPRMQTNLQTPEGGAQDTLPANDANLQTSAASSNGQGHRTPVPRRQPIPRRQPVPVPVRTPVK